MSFLGAIAQMVSASVASAPGGGSTNPILIAMLGESNSGGQEEIAAYSTLEKSVNPNVRILDPVNLDGFEDLQIGTNQNRAHSNLTALINVGLHNPIGTRARAGDFTPPVVYLVEGGQGGSQTSAWGAGSTFYTTFVSRMDVAITKVEEETGMTPDIYYFYTHGINDAIGGVATTTTFKANVNDLWDRIETLYGVNPVYMPELMLGFNASEAAFNAAIAEIVADRSNFHLIETSALPTKDAYHWGKTGLDAIGNAMIDDIIASRA